ncbi:MAG: hypothetical protein KJ970_10285 [Candidatus Eisenbacteria bacterium]|uniref:6-bladed beta-propeller n=1 Tax=Eiseniibacteriota bacterium TaxID=2212470 RepID=A0A948RUV1_UNCEI|nr:hypothetical protein [Candidatus Eisenbacteria bacterium]MBU2691305.1 hypothetical protein [Candidatus Eisenbacteria bacterium]
MRRILWVALMAVFLTATGVVAGEVVTIDGVTHIKNSAQPDQGIEKLELKELWRAGGDTDEAIFGLIIKCLVDKEGNIYLLDTQLSEVSVYSPEGVNIKTLSREGDGPGEIRGPADMLFLPDGTLGILQAMPGKIVKVDLEGNPAGNITATSGEAAEGLVVFTNAAGNETGLIISGVKITPGETGQTRTHFIASFDLEGNEKVRYYEQNQIWDFTNFELSEKNQYFPHGRYTALSEDGRVYTTPYRNDYIINVYKPDGTIDRIIEREYEPVKRNETEMNLINSAMEAARAQFPFEIKTSIEETEPDISRLFVDSAGLLWVLTSHGQRNENENVIATYDVFDKEGHFIKQVDVAGEGDGRKDFLMFAGDHRVVLVTGLLDAAVSMQGLAGEGDEDAAPMEIICFEY